MRTKWFITELRVCRGFEINVFDQHIERARNQWGFKWLNALYGVSDHQVLNRFNGLKSNFHNHIGAQSPSGQLPFNRQVTLTGIVIAVFHSVKNLNVTYPSRVPKVNATCTKSNECVCISSLLK